MLDPENITEVDHVEGEELYAFCLNNETREFEWAWFHHDDLMQSSRDDLVRLFYPHED
jgi:hypothetical protein